jgi:ligand-binding SRPBCC domain-containing protein
MKIKIQTLVHQPYQEVFKRFDKELFLKLAPPFPPIKLLRFDGCQKGDWVKVQLNFIFFKQNWESYITENEQNESEIYFVDEGKKLPFFLRYWHHKHLIVCQNEQQSWIIDDITYHSPFKLLDYLLYPMMYLQFVYRKPIYRKL